VAKVLIVDDNVELAGLLCAAVESRGFAGVAVHSGAEALRRVEAEPLALAIVDLLLPDMRGTDVLRALRAAKVPAIVITGVYKGSKFAEESKSLYGARAFFEKPFETGALLDAVSRHAARADHPGTTPLSPDEMALEEAVVEDEAVPLVEEIEEVDDALAATIERLGKPDVVTAPASPAPASPIVKPLPTLPVSAPAPSSDLPFADRKVWASRQAGKGRTTELRSGSLGITSVPRLFTAIYQGRQNGNMRLRRKDATKLLGFDRGMLVYAASNLENERFGAVAMRAGAITVEQLREIRSTAKAKGTTTALEMTQRGLINPGWHEELVREQVKEIAWSVIDWNDGEYGFSQGRLPAGLLPISLNPAQVVVEGVRRNFPLVRLRNLVDSNALYSPRPDPPYDLQELDLTDPEARVIAYADGTKSVEDLLVLTEADEKVVLGILHAGQLLGILEPRKESMLSRRIVFT
jgi:CheY-like chemotaxis protein